MESELLKGLDPFAKEIVMKNDGLTKSTIKSTTLSMKNIKWNKDYSMVKVESNVIT